MDKDVSASKTVTFTINNRTYEAIPALMKWEGSYIDYERLMRRAKRLKAELGEEEGEHILDFQDEIPLELSSKRLVFPCWDEEGEFVTYEGVFIYKEDDGCWSPKVVDDNDYFDERYCLVRRIS